MKNSKLVTEASMLVLDKMLAMPTEELKSMLDETEMGDVGLFLLETNYFANIASHHNPQEK